MARKEKSTPSRPEVEPGKPSDAAVLALEDRVARVRLLESGQETFLRAPLDAVPGEIATFVLEKLGTHRRQPCLIAKRTKVRLDVPALRLEPLRLKDLGTWDPATHDWGEGGSHPEWARSIVAAGPRHQSGLEDIVQSRRISLVDDAGVALPNPLLSAMMAMDEGDLGLALEIHDALLAADLRCLEAHSRGVLHPGSQAIDQGRGLLGEPELAQIQERLHRIGQRQAARGRGTGRGGETPAGRSAGPSGAPR